MSFNLNIEFQQNNCLHFLKHDNSESHTILYSFVATTTHPTHYYNFGSIMPGRNSNSGDYRYGFNGHEMDNEVKNITGSHLSFGDHGYDPRLGRRWQIDPVTPKYPGLSPYATFANSPIMVYDPDGYEGIVVSGQPGEHGNKQHFLANGLAKAKAAQGRTKNKGETVTWIIYNDGSEAHGHSPQMLVEYKEKAASLGITVMEVKTSKEIVNYVNKKNGNDDSRGNDKISSFYYVGHATPGDLDVGGATLFGGYIDVDELSGDAFQSGCWINVVGGCQTAVDGNLPFEESVVDDFVEILDDKSTISGSNVKVQYDGGVQSDEQILKENKGKIVTKKGSKKSGG